MPKKVLIIEDSENIGFALKSLIEFEGHEAIWATRAFIGFDLALTERPDLIIVDVMLPDQDGFELTRRLRAALEKRDTPIVCVSSHIHGHHDEAMAAGCDEAFSKSSFIESFDQTMKKYLGHDET